MTFSASIFSRGLAAAAFGCMLALVACAEPADGGAQEEAEVGARSDAVVGAPCQSSPFEESGCDAGEVCVIKPGCDGIVCPGTCR